MTKGLPVFILIIINFHATGQSPDRVVEYFEFIREGKAVNTNDVVKAEKPETVLRNVFPYYGDSLQTIRSAAYRLTFLTGITSSADNIRQQATQYLVQSLLLNNGRDVDIVITYLRQFNRADFNTLAEDSVRSLIQRGTIPQPELLKLAGYLEMHELENHFRLLAQPGNSQHVRWSALLALSRMGDAIALENVLTRVQKLRIADDVVYDIFPDLVFTHQKAAIQFMVDVMKSDKKDCFSADAEREVAIPCGYRVMEQLAPVVRGYPLKLDVSGDIKTKNYEEALVTVRTWFDKHPEFEVINSGY